jgi:ribosomal protein L32
MLPIGVIVDIGIRLWQVPEIRSGIEQLWQSINEEEELLEQHRAKKAARCPLCGHKMRNGVCDYCGSDNAGRYVEAPTPAANRALKKK